MSSTAVVMCACAEENRCGGGSGGDVPPSDVQWRACVRACVYNCGQHGAGLVF